METKKKEVSNAMDIGQQISKNDFHFLTENYKAYDNSNQTTFMIRREILEQNLTFSEHINGIRFMYGLKDSLNPNSKVLFLIPCSSISEKNISTEAMMREGGYYDHEGNVHSLPDVLLMMSQYVQHVSNINPEFTYKEITRGNFYGKNSLNSILIECCKFIQFDFGVKDNVISPIIQPLDNNYNKIQEIFMDFTNPCPEMCGGPGEDCLATLAVETYATNESELNEYRYFRDHLLLELEGGAQLFELYYLVSPVVAKIMAKNPNKEISLRKFYQEEIVPFKQLLKEGRHQEAVFALKETLYKLTEEYEYSRLFA